LGVHRKQDPLCFCIMTIYTVRSRCLNFCNFLRDDDRVALANLLSSHCLVVEVALVLIAISVYRAEETAATAGEPSQADLLLTGRTAILLLLAVLISVILSSASSGSGWLWLWDAGNCGLSCVGGQ